MEPRRTLKMRGVESAIFKLLICLVSLMRIERIE